MVYPILASGTTWYKGTTDKKTITQVNIVDTYTATGSETETWNADVDNSGSIKCYLNGAVLTIAGNGSGKISANPDSQKAFEYFEKMVSFNNGNLLDMRTCTNAQKMFNYCYVLETIDVSNWDMSNVTNMAALFQRDYAIKALDVSNWGVTNKCTDFRCTFSNLLLVETLDVSNWDMSGVEQIWGMFQYCHAVKELEVSNWNLSKVTDLHNTFAKCHALTLLDVSNWDVSNVTNMKYLFQQCFKLKVLDVSKWNTSKVTTMASMFAGEDYASIPFILEELDVSKWDVSSCTDMSCMFYGHSSVGFIDVSNWDVSNVVDFDHMFAHSRIRIGSVSKWKNSVAISMSCLFHSLLNEEFDIRGFETSNVQIFDKMFRNCKNLKRIIGLDKLDTSGCYSFGYMFDNCPNLQELDLSSFDTTKAKDGFKVENPYGSLSMSVKSMFSNMPNIKKLIIGDKFSFNGDGTTTSNTTIFPEPTFEGYDGHWYNTNGQAFTPNKIPNRTAGTYYAVNPTENIDINYGTMIDIGEAIRKNVINPSDYLASEMPRAIDEVYNNGYEQGYNSYVDGNEVEY